MRKVTGQAMVRNPESSTFNGLCFSSRLQVSDLASVNDGLLVN